MGGFFLFFVFKLFYQVRETSNLFFLRGRGGEKRGERRGGGWGEGRKEAGKERERENECKSQVNVGIFLSGSTLYFETVSH